MAAKRLIKKKVAKRSPAKTPAPPPVNRVRRAKATAKKKARAKKTPAPAPAPAADLQTRRTTKRTQVVVDARLEKTGQATEALPEDGTVRVPKRNKTTECAKCHRFVPLRSYRVVQVKRADAPEVRDSVCIACRAKEEAEDLRAERLERASDRDKRKEYRALRKQRTKEKVAEERVRRQQGNKQRQDTWDEKALANHAQRELARRELCRRRLLHFTRRFEGQKVDNKTGELVEVTRAKGKGYLAGWVHSDICARLERFLAAVLDGKQPRLMLFMPPRHGKSTLASRMFPAWALGHHPTIEVIAASYGAALPERFSRSVRGILRDSEYQAIFPETRLDPESENIQGWATTEGGLYVPAGVGSGISGKGADLLIIDDPFKGVEDAESPNAREGVLDWYYSEAYSRLSPNAGVLVICTRWHDADLAGSLISAQEEQEKESRELLEAELDDLRSAGLSTRERLDGEAMVYAQHRERLADVEQWEVVSYPAIAEMDEYRKPDGRITNVPGHGAKLLRHKGDALHGDRYPIKRLRRIKKNFYSRGRQRFWHALYQQKPVPDEGVHFSRSDLKFVDLPRKILRTHWLKLSTWDLAAGQKQQHDYTVGAYGELNPDGVLHVVSLRRGRFDGAHGIAVQILDDYEENRPHMIGVERGVLEQIVRPSIRMELEKRNKDRQYKNRLTPVFSTGDFALTPITDPVYRARPLQSLVQQGALVFSKDLQHVEEMIQELIRFPGAVHDDIVTALSWLARLALMHPAPREPTSRQRRKSWRDKLGSINGSLGHMAA